MISALSLQPKPPDLDLNSRFSRLHTQTENGITFRIHFLAGLLWKEFIPISWANVVVMCCLNSINENNTNTWWMIRVKEINPHFKDSWLTSPNFNLQLSWFIWFIWHSFSFQATTWYRYSFVCSVPCRGCAFSLSFGWPARRWRLQVEANPSGPSANHGIQNSFSHFSLWCILLADASEIVADATADPDCSQDSA